MLAGKGVIRDGDRVIRAGEGVGKIFKYRAPHNLTNFEVQKYYQNEPRFNGAYSRNNLPKLKHGAYAINLDEYKSIGTHPLCEMCPNTELFMVRIFPHSD